MTDQRIPDASKTISPCPKCWAVPKVTGHTVDYRGAITCILIEPKCRCIVDADRLCGEVSTTHWEAICCETLGRACRELSIETVEQLKARLAPTKPNEDLDALSLAIMFHNTYERLAPSVGYDTKVETRIFNPESTNGKLMMAVCEELLPILRPVSPDPRVAELITFVTVLLDLATDAASGLTYVRDVHGDLYGVGFERIKIKSEVLPVIRLKFAQLIAAQRGEVEK